MNERTKYLLSLVVVLLIGIFLGFLINGRLVKARVNRLQDYFTEQGFRYEFIHMLDPTPEQMDKIRPILMDYGQKNRENMMMYRNRQQELMMNLQHDLLPYLSKDQIQRMNYMRNRWDRRFMRPNRFGPGNGRMRRGRGGMPPGPPPPQMDSSRP